MERTHVLIARVRRAGMPRPDKIPWSAIESYADNSAHKKINMLILNDIYNFSNCLM